MKGLHGGYGAEEGGYVMVGRCVVEVFKPEGRRGPSVGCRAKGHDGDKGGKVLEVVVKSDAGGGWRGTGMVWDMNEDQVDEEDRILRMEGVEGEN